jgi:hypothetical protein
VRIDVQHRHQIAARIVDRDYDLRSGGRVAGDVPRERVYIGHYLRRPFPRGGAADAAIEWNLQASERSLIGADAQQPWRHDAIETRPTRVGKPLMEYGGAGRHRGDRVVHVFEHRVQLA